MDVLSTGVNAQLIRISLNRIAKCRRGSIQRRFLLSDSWLLFGTRTAYAYASPFLSVKGLAGKTAWAR